MGQVDQKKWKAAEGLAIEELHSSDMELGDDNGEETGSDDGDLDPDLKKALKIKDDKPQKKDKKEPKENAWELASKVEEAETVTSIKSKLLKFKAEMSKDAATVELKAHELQNQSPKEKKWFRNR